MSRRQTKETDLGNDKIGGLLFRLALPAIMAQVINLLYNLVDRMYIGHIRDIGPAALTGVGVTMPVIMAVSAFAALVSMGGAPRASIMMGRSTADFGKLCSYAGNHFSCPDISYPAVWTGDSATVRSQ